MRKGCCIDHKQGVGHGKNKGAWSEQEDQKLIHYIQTHRHASWRSIPLAAGLHRCGKSCRLRWINYLRPDIKRGNFDQDEEDLIIKLHALLGNRWSLIAGRLPGRTDNEVKNYWNSHIKKKLINMGIDPNNHRLHHHHHHHRPQNQTEMIPSDIEVEKSPNNNKNEDDDMVSDSASCLEDEKSITSGSNSDLNLDLTIGFPSNNLAMENCGMAGNNMTCEVESVTSPTLILFF